MTKDGRDNDTSRNLHTCIFTKHCRRINTWRYSEDKIREDNTLEHRIQVEIWFEHMACPRTSYSTFLATVKRRVAE